MRLWLCGDGRLRPSRQAQQRHEIESPSRRGCLEPGSRHLCKKRGCPFFEFFARILCDGVGTMMPAASGFRCHGSKVSSPAMPNLAPGIALRQPRPYATFSLVAGSRTTPFSTALHSKKSLSCDERPLPRMQKRTSSLCAPVLCHR